MAVREYSRSSHLEVFLGKGVLKICSKFTGEYPCRSASLINCTSVYGFSPVYKFAASIFSQHIFLKTPLNGCFWYTGYLAHFLVAFEKESICMLWKLNETKNFHNNLHDVLEREGRAGRGRNKMSYYILLRTNEITIGS